MGDNHHREEERPLFGDVNSEGVNGGETSVTKLFFSNLSDDLESTSHAHRYSGDDQEKLLDAESIDYLAPSSRVYKNWLARQVWGRHWDRWVVMALIGVLMGIVGFTLHFCIAILSSIKYQTTRWLLHYTRLLFVSWLWNVTVSLALVFASAWLVVNIAPDAAGSGVPEIMAYLNGCDVPRLFNADTLVVKYLSAALAVSSGLAVGPEGPVLVVGAILAARISQLDHPFFHRFNNPTDKRNFVTAGAAVGVATAFSAPVGGLLFMFEELASFWQQSLGWQVFFACMVSVFTADTLHSAVSALKEGTFGLFDDEASTVFFEVQTQLATHAMAMIPAAVVGLFSGLAAIAFTVLNMRVTRLRSRFLKTKQAKLMEPCVLIVVFITIGTILPLFFPCLPTQCVIIQGESKPVCPEGTPPRIQRIVEDSIELYTCSRDAATSDIPPDWDTDPSKSNITVPKSYNELATLISVNGEDSIRHLLSRGTHKEFGYKAILCFFVFYFVGAALAAGSAISSGVFVPMLLIGACIGRFVGLVSVNIAAAYGAGSDGAPPGVFLPPSAWSWIDPGLFALIGAGAFMGGVTRMTLALAVIIVEMSNDVRILLPAMVAIMLAKWVADAGCHSLYHGLMEIKCIPFLPKEPSTRSSLELIEVRHVMAKPVVTLKERMRLRDVREIIKSTRHNGFPIIRSDGSFIGTVARDHLLKLVVEAVRRGTTHQLEVGYEEVSRGLIDPMIYAREEEHQLAVLEGSVLASSSISPGSSSSRHLWDEELDLYPYINMSAYRVSETFSVEKAYLLFTTMGLRHLVVVDESNRVKGIVTRKDVLPYKLQEAASVASSINY
jgi:chloride channel 7